jgi:hypothetical protein
MLTASAAQAIAQANYWNLGSTYFNCNTGTTSSAPSNPVDLDASAFTVPGICQTYYRVNWVNVWGPPHGNALVVTDVSPNTSGHPFNGSGDQYYLINDGYMHAGASVAVGPMAANGSHKIYATYDNVIKSWTIDADGYVSGPVTLYTYGSSPAFDSRTATEVSSDGNYLLIKSAGTGMIVFNLSTNTPTDYPSPAGSIKGYEYVTGWAGTPRIYVSYNNMWFNPSGASGFGYYDLGNPFSFNNITTPPSGTDIRGFGFTDIEKAKNGRLYFVYNPTLSTSISNAGSLYSLTSGGVWAVVPSVSITYGTSSNWGYYIQTQIDGENYNNAAYPTPAVTSFSLNGSGGSSTPSYTGTPKIYRCAPGAPLALNILLSGMMRSYTISVRTGTITTANTFNPPYGYYGYSALSSANSLNILLSSIGAALNTYVGDIEVTFTPGNSCAGGATITRYYRIADVTVLAAYTKPGCISSGIPCSKPVQSTLPITTPPPAPSSSIATFRTNVDAAVGYMGAGNCGMFGINTNGNWTVSVYEVDSMTGARKVRSGITAPTIAYFTGSGAAAGATYFNWNTYAFDEFNPPFYEAVGSAYGDGPYFSDFYTWSRFGGTLASDFATRVYCAEMVVIEPTSGCSVTNKSYFKIAVNGTSSNGSNAKPGTGINEEEEAISLNIYPNPARSAITLTMPHNTENAVFRLMDNSGRKMLENNSLKTGKNEIDIRQLAPGIYFYEVNINEQRHHGKLVKE